MADKEAKRAALIPFLATETAVLPNYFLTSVAPRYSDNERKTFINKGANKKGPWIIFQGKLILPIEQKKEIFNKIHNCLHIGPRPLYILLRSLLWFTDLQNRLANSTKNCPMCLSINPQGHLRPPPSIPNHQFYEHLMGQDWQLDFTHKSKHKGYKYLLTLNDTFSDWLEALPTLTEKASEVTWVLLNGIIPPFGLPTSLQSDDGTGFASQITPQLSRSLGIVYKPHSAYHPQSSFNS